eukprot:UN2465
MGDTAARLASHYTQRGMTACRVSCGAFGPKQRGERTRTQCRPLKNSGRAGRKLRRFRPQPPRVGRGESRPGGLRACPPCKAKRPPHLYARGDVATVPSRPAITQACLTPLCRTCRCACPGRLRRGAEGRSAS